MKRILILAVVLCGAVALPLAAKPPGKKDKAQRQEQKTTLKELREKYDTDKDGKLSKTERAAVTAEDKAKLEKARADRTKAPRKKEASK